MASAIEADPKNPDAHQAQASLRISQQRADEAYACLMRGYALWRPKEEEEEEDGNDEDNRMDEGEDEEGDEDRQPPSYASRLAAAKMFLELGREEACEVPQTDGWVFVRSQVFFCFEKVAADILTQLLLENEDDPELYFLLALAGVERVDNLNLAAAKLLKARAEGQTDLEHLQRGKSKKPNL